MLKIYIYIYSSTAYPIAQWAAVLQKPALLLQRSTPQSPLHCTRARSTCVTRGLLHMQHCVPMTNESTEYTRRSAV